MFNLFSPKIHPQKHPLSDYRYLENNGRGKIIDYSLKKEVIKVLKWPFLWIFTLSFIFGISTIFYKIFILENNTKGFLYFLFQTSGFETWHEDFDFRLFCLLFFFFITIVFGYAFFKIQKIIHFFIKETNRRPIRASYLFYANIGSPFANPKNIAKITDFGHFFVFDFHNGNRLNISFSEESDLFKTLVHLFFVHHYQIPFQKNKIVFLVKIFSWMYLFFLLWIFINLLAS